MVLTAVVLVVATMSSVVVGHKTYMVQNHPSCLPHHCTRGAGNHGYCSVILMSAALLK